MEDLVKKIAAIVFVTSLMVVGVASTAHATRFMPSYENVCAKIQLKSAVACP
jgi:hypothetical protein